jgi:hypothetical protein
MLNEYEVVAMRLERQHPNSIVDFGTYLGISADIGDIDRREAVIRELRDRYDSPVELAKQPDLLYRLHAILNA